MAIAHENSLEPGEKLNKAAKCEEIIREAQWIDRDVKEAMQNCPNMDTCTREQVHFPQD